MGHSIQKFRGDHLILNDFDIGAMIGILDLVSNEHPDQDSKLPHLWSRQLEVAGVGCIDLPLDEIAGLPEDRASLLEVLSQLRNRVLSFGATIPSSAISDIGDKLGAVFVSEYPSHSILKLLAQLEELLGRHEVRTDRSTTGAV